MDHTGFLTGNLTLDLAIFAWFIAQLLKTLINLVVNRSLDLKRMVGSGNMPSSHSAFICAATASIGQICGWRDPLVLSVCGGGPGGDVRRLQCAKGGGGAGQGAQLCPGALGRPPGGISGEEAQRAPGAHPASGDYGGPAGHRHRTDWADDLVNRLGDREPLEM